MPMSMRSLGNGRGSDRDFVYLLMLARKYGLEPAALHNALVRAKSAKAASCGSLSIELRERRDNGFCLMFSRDNRSVAQATVSETSIAKLQNIPQELKKLLINQPRQPAVNDQANQERHIADLQIGSKHVNLKAKVTEKSEVRAVESRNGSPLLVCVATLSDGTGQIRLPLWNKQIDSISKNDQVVIRDATVRNFRGEMQLSIPAKTGSLSTIASVD